MMVLRRNIGNLRIDQKGCAGFTLVETLVALLILAVAMAGFAFALKPHEIASSPVRIAEQIQMMLLHARSDAIMSGRNKSVAIDVEAGRLRFGAQTVSLSSHLSLRLLTGQELVATDGQATLVFLSDGGSSGAEIEIIDQRGRRALVRVNWLTGLPILSVGGDQ